MLRSTIAILFLGISAIVFCSRPEPPAQEFPPSARPAFADSLSDLISPDAKLEKIETGLTFAMSGAPCWDDNRLFFSNISFNPPENSRTYRMGRGGNIHLIRENNGIITAMVPTGTGTFDCCETGGHRISEMDFQGKVIRTVAGEYQGVRLDNPYDLAMDARGGIYFTDSHMAGPEFMQRTAGIYYIRPDSTVLRVNDDILHPLGIALSPDGTFLYVTSTGGEDQGRYVQVFDIASDGILSNKRRFCELRLAIEAVEQAGSIPEAAGCEMDVAGNLYVAATRGPGLQVFNAAGEYLGTIDSASPVTNCTFGGPDMRTLYVSALDGIYIMPTLLPRFQNSSS